MDKKFLIIGVALGFIGAVLFLTGTFDGDVPPEKDAKVEVAEPVEAPEDEATAKALVKQTITPFTNPESVLYDEGRDQFYVSEANFGVPSGGGKVALLDGAGKIVNADWVTGLNHPKGLGMTGDKLYVADVTEILEIDIPSGKVVETYPVEGAVFLNDVTVAPDGDVYVSDTITNQIIKVGPDGSLEVWLSDEQLENPNGLLVHNGALYVAAWGKVPGKTGDDLGKAGPTGRLMKVSLEDKSITVLSKGPVGNLDGLEADEDGNFYVSDWIAGKLFHMSGEGAILKTYDMAKLLGVSSAQGLADIDYISAKGEIWAPMMMQGSVLVLPTENLKALK